MAKKRLEHDIFGTKPRDTINSKKKGDTNERVAAKWLKKWTGEGFIRTPSSGGRRLQNASNFCGDVVCENEDFDFMFTVETKHYKNLPMPTLLRNNSQVFTIWNQAVRDSIRSGKEPMLMLRENGMPEGEFMIYWRFMLPGVFHTSTGIKVLDDDSIVSLYGYETKIVLNHWSYENIQKIFPTFELNELKL